MRGKHGFASSKCNTLLELVLIRFSPFPPPKAQNPNPRRRPPLAAAVAMASRTSDSSVVLQAAIYGNLRLLKSNRPPSLPPPLSLSLDSGAKLLFGIVSL
jgi:hypothetical protein